EEARLELQRETERLAPLDADILAQLDLQVVSQLSDLARDAEAARLRRVGFEEEIRRLPIDSGSGDRRMLETGVRILQDWLATPPSRIEDSKLRPIAIAASIVLLLVGAGLAV